MKRKSEQIKGTEKEFMAVFRRLCYSRSSWQVWADLMSAIACSISNVTDRTPEHFQAREREYSECIKRLGSVETAAEILHIIVMALENEPEQDFLGKMYMNLNLGNHWKGQFFTPYDICKAMSQMTIGNVDRQIEEQGYISICDPCCGAGATLIAAANTMKDSRYNFQNHVLFIGQDIDRVVSQMCYIQLSLLGCAGYVHKSNVRIGIIPTGKRRTRTMVHANVLFGCVAVAEDISFDGKYGWNRNHRKNSGKRALLYVFRF